MEFSSSLSKADCCRSPIFPGLCATVAQPTLAYSGSSPAPGSYLSAQSLTNPQTYDCDEFKLHRQHQNPFCIPGFSGRGRHGLCSPVQWQAQKSEKSMTRLRRDLLVPQLGTDPGAQKSSPTPRVIDRVLRAFETFFKFSVFMTEILDHSCISRV